MAVYKDNATGTWRVIYRFTNWKGERKQTQKRGFATKREAEYETVVLKPTEQQKEIVESLGERAEVVRNGGVDAAVDNMLKITNDGRKLALDQRLVNELLPDNPESKISVCAEKSYEIWKDTAAQKSAQLIFCDCVAIRCYK